MERTQPAWIPQEQRAQKRRVRTRDVALGVIVAAIIAVVAFIPVALSNSGPVTMADAVQNLVKKIESGPNWKTARMSNALAGYLKGKSTEKTYEGAVSCTSLLARGRHVGCGGCLYVNGRNPNLGFACYLQASASHHFEASYFSENASAGKIRPISLTKFSKLLNSTGAYRDVA